jgi:sulfane dehydrogenase subunit SoxC
VVRIKGATTRMITSELVAIVISHAPAMQNLQEPVLPKAFTRFRMPWHWDGTPAVLQSRAGDEAGNVQPTRAEFVAARGQTEKPVASPLAFPNQHYNSITSWGVGTNGEVKHVYV